MITTQYKNNHLSEQEIANLQSTVKTALHQKWLVLHWLHICILGTYIAHVLLCQIGYSWHYNIQNEMCAALYNLARLRECKAEKDLAKPHHPWLGAGSIDSKCL